MTNCFSQKCTLKKGGNETEMVKHHKDIFFVSQFANISLTLV